MLLLVFLLWQITQKQHQYVDILHFDKQRDRTDYRNKIVWIVWQLDYMEVLIYVLYKVQMILFGTDKMLYGIFSFSCGNAFGFFV